ncbi:type VI secretion system baseplate subunit TssK [Alcaligenaceae bacterium B3P038]|nr:type VI secretion system baseplate subunit TssK [Alcaligenaceae bacterium B3P038]
MASNNKVVWSEGMFLRPQHFQQFERYLEHRLQARTVAQQSFFWGFSALEIDIDALAIGKLVLRRAQGVFPDGTPFDFAGLDQAPPAFEVPVQTLDARVVLAVPRSRPGTEEVVFEDGDDTLARYRVTEIEVADTSVMSLEPALVQTGALRLRIMLAADVSDEWISIDLAHIAERRSDNRVVLRDAYIPPWLAAGDHAILDGYTNELSGLLDARSEALAARLSQPGRGGVAEVSDFMLLEAVNRYMGALWHARQIRGVHPERLYHDWLMLACDLATYTAVTRRPTVMPEYRHDDLFGTFSALMTELRRSLSAVLEQNAMEIPLQDRGQGVRVGQIPDLELMRSAAFVLAVHADLPSEVVRSRFPSQVKIGPVERIRDLVHLQLPGVAVRALPVVPRQIPYAAGYVYFELDKAGEFWRQLEKTGALALHLAGEFPGLSMAFWAIRD